MKLLVVDDEYLVVEEIMTITDWELLGITQVWSASNAIKAQQLLKEQKIDIMLCDIEMPQVDGLELLMRAKKEFPELEVVMLTSHAQFDYVRNALRYGSYDYLLKPVMQDDIVKVMQSLVAKIERERRQVQLQEEGLLWNQLIPAWKEKYWEEQLRGLGNSSNSEGEEAWRREWEEELDRLLIPVLFYQYANDREVEGIKQRRQEIMDVFQNIRCNVLFPVLSQKMFAALYFIDGEKACDSNKFISDRRLFQLFENSGLKEQIGICIGGVCTGREVQSKVDMLRQLAANNVCSRRQIRNLEDIPEIMEITELPDMAIWKTLLDNGKVPELQAKMIKWLNKEGAEGRLNRGALQMFQYDLEQVFYSVLQENGILAHQFLYYRECGRNRVTAIRSVEEMEEWATGVLGDVSRILMDIANPTGIKERTVHYIKTHLCEDINRIKVAESMYLNPDYLDRRFKKETGYSVNRYILKEKVNMAKILLIEGEVSISEIASRCGYENMSNFSVMFKREVGVSPNEYRKSKV